MVNLKKLVIFIVNLPLYFLSKIVPKNEDVWVFGAWFGKKYSDNARYLFEHINKHEPTIRAVWLSSNSKTVNEIRSLGYEAYLTYSLKGYFVSFRACVGFICCGFDDINLFVRPKYIINLWHGNPLKKILYDDKISKLNRKSLLAKVKDKVFPFSQLNFGGSMVIASSEEEAITISSAFKLNMDNILITGLPRNDSFRKSDINLFSGKIIYMPTHRNEGDAKIPSLNEKEIDGINEILEAHDLTIEVKLHHYHDGTTFPKKSRFREVSPDGFTVDAYSEINKYDILITDYSSIYFDFLLTEKPIIFFPFDKEEYLKNDRELYYDYDEVTPGPKCNNWLEVIDWAVKFNEDPTIFLNDRKKIKNRFHKYVDFESCERVTAIAKSLRSI